MLKMTWILFLEKVKEISHGMPSGTVKSRSFFSSPLMTQNTIKDENFFSYCCYLEQFLWIFLHTDKILELHEMQENTIFSPFPTIAVLLCTMLIFLCELLLVKAFFHCNLPDRISLQSAKIVLHFTDYFSDKF